MTGQSAPHPDLPNPDTEIDAGNPPPETAASWPFPKPPRTAGSRFKRGGALYVWLYRQYETLSKAQATPEFAWRNVAYEAGKSICSQEVFQPPTPAQVAATWKKVCSSVRRSGHDPSKWADAVFPGDGAARTFPPLPPPPAAPSRPAQAILAAARRQADPRCSPIYQWMVSNYDELQAAFEKGTPNWGALADALEQTGLSDDDGNPPKRGTVAQTWYRVRRAMTRRVARSGQVQAPAVHFLNQPTTHPSESMPGSIPSRSNTASDHRSEPLPNETAGASVEDRLRAFRAGLNAGKVRIPEPINPAMPKGNNDGETR